MKLYIRGTLLITALLLFVCQAVAIEPSKLDCISNPPKDQKVEWNSIWQPDRKDHGAIYRIVSVSEINRIPTRQVTLEMRAVDSASSATRRLVVSTEEIARSVCDRFVKETTELKFPGQSETNLDTLPFIHFTKDGWVRGTATGSETLRICRLGHLRFSCPENDFQRFGGTLRTLEDDLKAQITAGSN